MLTRLYCDNYKCLVNFEFRPGPIQLLMGRNGAGKSTVFEVLELIRDFAARGDDCSKRLAGMTKTRWQDRSIQTFELDVRGPQGLYTYKLVVGECAKPWRFDVKKEQLLLDGKPVFTVDNGIVQLRQEDSETPIQFPVNPRRPFLSDFSWGRPLSEITWVPLNWFSSWLEGLIHVQIDPKQMRPEAGEEQDYPSRDLSNFAGWYRYLRQGNLAVMEQLRTSLAEVIDGFESLDLKGPANGTRSLQVTVRTGGESGGGPRHYRFEELSDGQRALIGLYTLLHAGLMYDITLCIDEPDNFVALREIQPWLSRLEDRLLETNSQVLIISHHPELLNQLAPQAGLIIERAGAGPARVRPFAPSGDSTLTPAEIIARGWEND